MPNAPQFKITKNRLSDNGGAPLYRQIYDLFKKQIVSGRVEKDTLLPSEQEITQLLGVSRITVRRALNELAASGLVTRRRGRGTIVSFNAAAPTVKASFENLIDGLTRMGVETDVKLISYKTVVANQALSSLMELPRGVKVQRIVRLRMLDNEPFSHLRSHIPEHIAAKYDANELNSASIIQLLDSVGHRPCAATQEITAVSADENLAGALGITEGVPLLRIHRLMRDENNKVVQEITSHYRSDRFQYQMTLSRSATADWTRED